MTAKKPTFPPDEPVCRSMFTASPPPPKRTDRPRVIRDVGQAVVIQSALGDIDKAVRILHRAGLSWDDIELAFFEAMKDTFNC